MEENIVKGFKLATGNVYGYDYESLINKPVYDAAAYDPTSTYELREYCTKDGKLYRCIVPITTAEEWTSAHWKQTTVGDEINNSITGYNILVDSEAKLAAVTGGSKSIDDLPLNSIVDIGSNNIPNIQNDVSVGGTGVGVYITFIHNYKSSTSSGKKQLFINKYGMATRSFSGGTPVWSDWVIYQGDLKDISITELSRASTLQNLIAIAPDSEEGYANADNMPINTFVYVYASVANNENFKNRAPEVNGVYGGLYLTLGHGTSDGTSRIQIFFGRHGGTCTRTIVAGTWTDWYDQVDPLNIKIKDNSYGLDSIFDEDMYLTDEVWKDHYYWAENTMAWTYAGSNYPFESINRIIPRPEGFDKITISVDSGYTDYEVKFIYRNLQDQVVSTGFTKLSTLPESTMRKSLEDVKEFSISARYYVDSVCVDVDVTKIHIQLSKLKNNELFYEMTFGYWSNSTWNAVASSVNYIFRDVQAIDCSKWDYLTVRQNSSLGYRIRLIGIDKNNQLSYSDNIYLDNNADVFTFDLRKSGWQQIHINLSRNQSDTFLTPVISDVSMTYVTSEDNTVNNIRNEIDGLRIGAVNYTYASGQGPAPIKVALFGASIVVGQYGYYPITFDSSTVYKYGDYARYSGQNYKYISDVQSSGAWDANNWQLVPTYRNNVGNYGPYVEDGIGYYKLDVSPWDSKEKARVYSTIDESDPEYPLIGRHWAARLHQYLKLCYPNNNFVYDNYAIGAVDPINYYKILTIGESEDGTVHNYLYDQVRDLDGYSRAIAIVMLGNNGRKYSYDSNVNWNTKTLQYLKSLGYEVYCCTPTPSLSSSSSHIINTYQIMQSFKESAEMAKVPSLDTFNYIIDYCDSQNISIKNTDEKNADSICFLASDNLHPSVLGQSIIFKGIRSMLKI